MFEKLEAVEKRLDKAVKMARADKKHQIEGFISASNTNCLQELKINNKGDIAVSKITNNPNYKRSYFFFSVVDN